MMAGWSARSLACRRALATSVQSGRPTARGLLESSTSAIAASQLGVPETGHPLDGRVVVGGRYRQAQAEGRFQPALDVHGHQGVQAQRTEFGRGIQRADVLELQGTGD